MFKKTIITALIIASLCLTLCSCQDEYGNYFFEEKNENYAQVDATSEDSEVESKSDDVSSEPETDNNEPYKITYENDQRQKEVTDDTGTKTICKIDINVPMFDISRSDGTDCTNSEYVINNFFSNTARTTELEAEKLSNTAKEDYAEAKKANREFVPYESSMTYKVTRSDQIISVAFSYYQYTGGVHGSSGMVGITLLTETAKELKLEDIVKSTNNFYEFAADYLCDVLDKGEYQPFEDYEDNMLSEIRNCPWYLNDEGIVFIFNEYQIAPYSEGIYELVIPYGDASEYLFDWVIK